MSERIKEYIRSIDQVLPISTSFSVVSLFFSLGTICFALTNYFTKNKENVNYILFIEFAIIFLLLLITFCVIGAQQSQKISKCKECINQRNGFHNRGLIEFDELLLLESKLNPGSEVLVYTSCAITKGKKQEKVLKTMTENILQKKIKYTILYFYDPDEVVVKELKQAKDKYGEIINELVKLKKMDEKENSFDSKLATALGFDVFIYKDSKGKTKGFFAVDYYLENNNKDCSICPEKIKCNFGRENSQEVISTFYKEMSDYNAVMLYNEWKNNEIS